MTSIIDFSSRAVMVGLAMVYPGYKSFKAIKSSDITRQKQLLQYWLVLSVLSALSVLFDPILYTRVPFYGLVKIGAVAYLVLPKTEGYKAVYATVLEPQLSKHSETIDAHAEKFVQAAQAHAQNLGPLANQYKAKLLAATQGLPPTKKGK